MGSLTQPWTVFFNANIMLIPAKQDMPIVPTVSQRSWGQPTTFGLDLRPAPQEGTYALCCKPGQTMTMAQEVMGPRGEPIIVDLAHDGLLACL